MGYLLINNYLVKNLTNENKKILEFLTRFIEQADTFTYEFLTESPNENLAVNDYRLNRILQKNTTLTEFLDNYSTNPMDALDELFMYPIREQEFSQLTNKINSGKITIEKLFEKHKKRPRVKLMRLLL